MHRVTLRGPRLGNRPRAARQVWIVPAVTVAGASPPPPLRGRGSDLLVLLRQSLSRSLSYAAACSREPAAPRLGRRSPYHGMCAVLWARRRADADANHVICLPLKLPRAWNAAPGQACGEPESEGGRSAREVQTRSRAAMPVVSAPSARSAEQTRGPAAGCHCAAREITEHLRGCLWRGPSMPPSPSRAPSESASVSRAAGKVPAWPVDRVPIHLSRRAGLVDRYGNPSRARSGGPDRVGASRT